MRSPGILATVLLSLVVAAPGCNSAAVDPVPQYHTTQTATNEVATTAKPVVSVDDVHTLVHRLASEEMEGRGVGTRGLDLAADYIAQQFARAGVRPPANQRDHLQRFEMTTASEVAPATALRSGERVYELNNDFIPLGFSAEGEFAGPLVFAGYGISSQEHGYDDYVNLDVTGKVVLIMRYEPHDAQGRSRFTERDGWSTDAHLSTKARNALDRGAAAILFVTPPSHHADEGLMPFARAVSADRRIPALHVRLAVANELLKRGGAPDLKTIQNQIDSTAKPRSFQLDGVEVSGRVALHRKRANVKNVVAMVRGTGPRAHEYVVIGAHYDHLGYGGFRSLSPATRAIHYGADDNASGTATLIHLAQRLATNPPQRSVIFVAFTAEEEGIIGSEYFLNNSPVPVANIAAMINLDMVGRLRDDTLFVGGAGTAEEFDNILNRVEGQSPLQLKDIGRGGLGPSDHMAFALRKIPVLFFFTGVHEDYHRPTDTPDKINYEGLEQIIDLVEQVARELASMPRATYITASDVHSMRMGAPSPTRVTLGIIPDYASLTDAGGVRVAGTAPQSPADRAGLRRGDIITRFGDTPVDNLHDLSHALTHYSPGDVVKIEFRRADETHETEATLAPRR